MGRWSLLKTGHCVWLEVASIFLSLVFENGKEARQDDRVQVCLLPIVKRTLLL